MAEFIKVTQTDDIEPGKVNVYEVAGKQIAICNVDGTFYAKLIIEQDGQEIEVDSRPSDAIALGVAQSVPIYVAEHVLAQTESDSSNNSDSSPDVELDWD